MWQILDVNSIWMKEFASALSKRAPVVSWSPVMLRLGAWQRWQRQVRIADPALEVLEYPLQRGYARPALSWLLPFEGRVLAHLHTRTSTPQDCALVCTTPFYAPVAERWPGPVVYYVTDLTAGYDGLDPAQVIALDRRACRVARAVCPNSSRIAEYLVNDAGCDPERVTVIPNATRASNIAGEPLLQPGPLPADIAHLPRPIAGVIGNLSANMNWSLLAATVEQTPYLAWIFVGPTTMPIADRSEEQARAAVMRRAHFVGAKPYGELQDYARSFDVAVLPYRKKEPTYSGSSTRFYEHLAACRPMIATRGFRELLEKQPLVELVETAPELVAALDRLRQRGFADGQERSRWEASQTETWDERAGTMARALEAAESGVGLPAVRQTTWAAT